MCIANAHNLEDITVLRHIQRRRLKRWHGTHSAYPRSLVGTSYPWLLQCQLDNFQKINYMKLCVFDLSGLYKVFNDMETV
jgi:cbb3-type cytochrome oxidase cytochrome c subunit